MASLRWHPPAAGNLDLEARLQDKKSVVDYLHGLGFVQDRANIQNVDLTDPLKALQKSAGLAQTGTLDESTVSLMAKSCCGYIRSVADTAGPESFTLEASKWDHTSITYRIDSYTADMTQADIRAAFAGAFAKWANVTPLTFTEVAAGADADIRIRFAVGDHGDGSPFDGVANILAHAFNPGNGATNIAGDAHFDDAETWTFDYLSKVALHEFGHSIGLGHSTLGTAVMYAYFNNEGNLQPDDITGVQSLYGPRKKGWFNFQLDTTNTVAPGADVAAVSRIKDSMEVWWIAPNGSIQDAYWYANAGWKRFELAPPSSAVSGGIAALSRIPGSMEVWWVSPTGSVEGAFWYENKGWNRYQIAPAGSAAWGTRITAVSRIPTSMELFWVGGDGSVQDAYWYENAGWKRFALAPAGSAAIGGGIKVVSRIPGSMECWWVTPNGAIHDAFWYDKSGWGNFEFAPPGSADLKSGIAATHRISTSMEVWWIGPNGSVQDAYWYDKVGWKRFELAPAGSAQAGGIEAISRVEDSMEVWWTSSNGAVQDAFWYGSGAGWQKFQLGGPGSARPGSEFAVTSRIPESMEFWFAGPAGQLADFYFY
jgi:hypothetical protein